MREEIGQCAEPFFNPCLASIDLLTAAHQAHDCAPILVAIHYAEQEFWLRHGETCSSLFLHHEFRSLHRVPRALGFIKNCDFLDRRPIAVECFVAKMMDILDESRGASALQCL